MIKIIIFIIILILLTINIINLVKIKWNNDYLNLSSMQCKDTNNALYEYETYRYNLYNYLENSKYNNSIYKYKVTYNIINILIIVLLVLYLIKKKNKIVILLFLLYIIYSYINYNINIELKTIENNKTDTSNYYYRYSKIYKILNSLLYLDDDNNILNQQLQYYNKDLNNDKTFDEILSFNISNIYNISNSLEINNKKKEAYKKLDFVKYITLNELSPYFFKDYFDNMYVILDNNKYYLNELDSYDLINNKIKKQIGDKDDINYVQYYLENKNLLFNNTNEIKTPLILNRNTNLLLIIYIILLIILLHYLYTILNSKNYILLLFILFIMYILLFYIYLRG